MRNKKFFEKFQIKTQKLINFNYVRHERYPELDLGLNENDFLYELAKVNPTNLFLGRFSKEEIQEILTKEGLWDLLAQRGFKDIVLEIDASNVLEHRLGIYNGEASVENMLIEIRLREGVFRPKKHFVPESDEIRDVPMILIDWLMLQDPTKEFEPDKPRLVHQRKPGLGIFHDFTNLVDLLADSAGKEAVMDIPEHYHGALLYSKLFHFWDPGMEGKLKAMMRDFKSVPLHKATWAVFLDCCLNCETDEDEKWEPGEQIKPVSKRMKKYFDHHEYKKQVDEVFESASFKIDEDRLDEAMKKYSEFLG